MLFSTSGFAVDEYNRLTSSGYVFAPAVLCELLQLCMTHSLEECSSNGVSCCSLALHLYKEVCRSSPSNEDSYAVYRVLLSHDQSDWYNCYMA